MKDFEKLIKEKLEKDGVSKEWMKDHLIIEGLDDDWDTRINIGVHLYSYMLYRCWFNYIW